MEDAAAPPAANPPAPADAPASAAPAAATPPAPGAAPGPSPSDERARRLRLQAKVAGVMMMLFGAFFAINFGLAAYNGPKLADTYATYPGGNVTIAFPGAAGANVTLVYRSGAPSTHAALDGSGGAVVKALNATFTVQVASGGETWSREAFVPLGTAGRLDLDRASPRESGERVGVPTSFYQWLWLPALGAILLVVGGYFAFKLRAPRVAMGAAFLFVLGAGFLLMAFGPSLLALSFIGTAVLCFAFVYRARTEFSPFRARPAP